MSQENSQESTPCASKQPDIAVIRSRFEYLARFAGIQDFSPASVVDNTYQNRQTEMAWQFFLSGVYAVF